ncbi:MAG: hypothetical protein ACU85V_08570 [Gammaproteobacteria bacterium]
MTTSHANVIAATSIRAYFHDAFSSASRNQDVTLDEMTAAYVINLLTTYSHSSALRAVSDEGAHHKPLAAIYAEALAADGPEQRSTTFQQLGDIALFIAGIFTDSLNRKLVDVDYYIGMGESAYASVHDTLSQRADRFARVELFDELRRKFAALVDVLAEISENSGLKSNADLLRTYEIWMRTGSERARRQLERSGVVPLAGLSTSPTH